jgi:hypothetical protein
MSRTAASPPEADFPPSTPEGDDLQSELPADHAVRRKRRWGCAILIALALATPVILFVGAYVGIVWSSDRLAGEAIAKARDAGDPVDLPSIGAFYPTSPAIDEATAHWLRASEIVGDPAFHSSMKGIPLFDGTRTVDEDEILRPGDLERVTPFLDRYRKALDASHAARRAGSVARFPIDFDDGIAMLIPHVQNLRSLNRLLQLDLEVKLAQGDREGAVEDLLSLIATSESLKNEPILVSQLVRIACLGVAIGALERTLAHHQLSDEQLARIQEALARQQLHDSLKRALRGEQFFLIHVTRTNGSTGNPGADWARALPFRGADMAKGMELWRKVLDASDEGMLETLTATQEMEKEIEAVAGSPIDRLRYSTTVLLFPAVDAATKAFLRGEASARLAETGVACERYRLAHDKLPAKLDDLVPEFLPAVPLDPFDRQPLRYRVTESGALLYSLGVDQLDDGGLEDPVDGDLTFELQAEKSPAEEAP